MTLAGPIVTLTTDFGLGDWYVAAIKSVLLRVAPQSPVVDVTHLIEPGDILAGAICLERALAAFPSGTVHLAVVDPTVGTDRRILIVRVAGQQVVCPDNGLITWAWRRNPGAQAHELTWRPASSSGTFHGRDIMGPVAGMLASGHAEVGLISRPIDAPVLLDVAPVVAPNRIGRVIYFDRFGNAITDMLAEVVQGIVNGHIRVGNQDLGAVEPTYAGVASGQALALIGSSGLLEISVRDGSAREQLGLRIGDRVEIV